MLKILPINDFRTEFDLPDICPNCGLGIIPTFLGYSHATSAPYVGIIFECPSCKKIGFANFFLYTEKTSAWVADLKNGDDENFSKCIAVYPEKIYTPTIPKAMKNYYPEFYEVYSQAHIAEQKNLDKITGMAYRKALENLVKNYLLETFPDKHDEILDESLGKSISRITYPKIQSLARAASWIGNDETHMVKKNPDWEVKDMKGFILALCHLILAEKVANSAVNMITVST